MSKRRLPVSVEPVSVEPVSAGPVDENVVASGSLTPTEPESMTAAEVKEALSVASDEVRLMLVRPCFINGKQYGPGDCVVPKDAFHIWKACV